MKRLLRCCVVAMVAMMVGTSVASADTNVIQDGVGGWKKLTALPSSLSDYYYVFVDNSQDLMLSLARGKNQGGDYHGMYYKTSANPLVDRSMLWTLEANGDYVVITNAEYSSLFLQTENNAAWNYRTHDNGGGEKSWGNVKATLANGKWTLQNGKYPNSGYLGPWSDVVGNGAELAANKSGDAIGYFQIYAIAKSDAQAYWDGLNAGTGASATAPLNMTGLISNPNACYWADSKPYGWTTTGTQNVNMGNGFDEAPCFFEFSDWWAGSWTGSIKQTLAVPNGKYLLKAALQASNGVTAYLTANNDQSEHLNAIGAGGGNILADGTETSMGNGVAGWQYLTLETIVTGGSLELGAYAEASGEHLWVNADNFTLWYYGPTVSSVATALPENALAANAWYYFDVPSEGEYTIDAGSNLSDIVYTTDGTQLVETATGNAWSGSEQTLSAGRYYVKSISAQTLSAMPNSYHAGDNLTSRIVNPGFEDDKAVVNVTSNALDAITGWQFTTVANTNDVGTRAYSNATYATINGVGNYCVNCFWEGKPLIQNIGSLPAGTYELSALVTTGNETSKGTVYLNANDVHSTGYARLSANANFFVREKLVFTLESPTSVTIGVRGGSDVAEGATKGAYNENGYWWYKADDFQLKYICDATQAALYAQLQQLIADCQPWTSGDEYANKFATYSAYTAANSVAELTEAIDYINNEFYKYGMEYGTNNHPYDMDLIVNPTYDDNTNGWDQTQNSTGGYSASVTSDGSQTNYFNVAKNEYLRHSTIYQEGLCVDEGLYKLTAKMKGTPKDDESTYIYATTGAVAHWETPVFKGDTYYGYLTTDVASDWTTVEAYIILDAPAQLGIGVLSWGNNYSGGYGGAYSVDDWKLVKINNALVNQNNVLSAIGEVPSADINAALTSDISVLNLENASGLSNVSISTTNNPNLLIYTASSSQVSNSKNVIASGTCSSLHLVKGNTTFIVPKAFTAISATYEVKSTDLAGGSFATLMIPFAANGSAFALDQDIAFSDATMKGTAVTTIPQNKPVLVKAAQTLTASNASIPVIAKNATFTNGKLVGVYSPTTAPMNSYVLQNHSSGDGVAFYRVNETQPTVNPFRAYLSASVGEAKAIFVSFDDDATGISAEKNSIGVEDIYSVDGLRLQTPQKGVNIVKMKDGSVKKLIIK